MGGHGGLNILPQKRWNVYNYDNREKVRRDEEAAAREEQVKRDEVRKRDAESRVEKLRQARGLPSRGAVQANDEPSSAPARPESVVAEPSTSEAGSKHINLFDGIRIFDPVKVGEGKREEKKGKFWDENRNKKVKKEEVRAVGPEDEKYRLGYGVAGKGVNVPWYMQKKMSDGEGNGDDEEWNEDREFKKRKIGAGKKSLEELREERMKRERMEKERERALVMERSRRDGGFSSRRR